jgi:hypothetical protein
MNLSRNEIYPQFKTAYRKSKKLVRVNQVDKYYRTKKMKLQYPSPLKNRKFHTAYIQRVLDNNKELRIPNLKK